MIVLKGDRMIVVATMELGRQVAEQDALRLLGILAGLRDLPDQIRVHNTPPRTCLKRRRGRFRANCPRLSKARYQTSSPDARRRSLYKQQGRQQDDHHPAPP
jgi:hypothetical protein